MTEKRFEVWEQEPTRETTKSEVKMTTKRFITYFDSFMEQWTVQNTETLEMYPVTSENMGNEFCRLLNAQHEEIQSLKDQLKNLRRLVNEAYMEGNE